MSPLPEALWETLYRYLVDWLMLDKIKNKKFDLNKNGLSKNAFWMFFGLKRKKGKIFFSRMLRTSHGLFPIYGNFKKKFSNLPLVTKNRTWFTSSAFIDQPPMIHYIFLTLKTLEFPDSLWYIFAECCHDKVICATRDFLPPLPPCTLNFCEVTYPINCKWI